MGTHVLVIVLMLGLMAHDASGFSIAPKWEGWALPVWVLGSNVLLMLWTHVACRFAARKLRKGAAFRRVLPRLDRQFSTMQYAVVGLFLYDLYGLGWLTWLRGGMGDWVALDELVAVAPVLLALLAGWFSYYAVDRQVRGAAGTRLAYVASQFRHQVLLILAPLLLVMAWMQGVGAVIGPHPAWRVYEQPLIVLGFTTVFLFAPVMIRYIWDTVPLPEGPVRDGLMGMCRSSGVRVRQLLLWRTYGGTMINGAVMGLIAPLRYILLTDGLLGRMSATEVQAVMAHELCHVRKRHMAWLVVCAMACIFGMEHLVHAAMEMADGWSGGGLLADVPGTMPIEWAGLGLVLTGWLTMFGWVSRRFERQADAFAVRHLAISNGSSRFDRDAVEAYCRTLLRVARLNNMAPERRSWRHGSILWRCDYLLTLVGQPLESCTIDTTVRRVCLAAAALLAGLLVYQGLTTG